MNAEATLGSSAWFDAVRSLHASLVRVGFRQVHPNPTGRSRFVIIFEPRVLWAYLKARTVGFSRRTVDLERRLAFFYRNEVLSEAQLRELLAALDPGLEVRALLDAGVVERVAGADALRCGVRFYPVGDLLIVSDRPHPDSGSVHTGTDTLAFSEWLRLRLEGKRFRRALDLCCGSGVQGLTVSAFADFVEGTDISPRAVAYAELNAQLAGVADRTRFGVRDLARGLPGPYDLIVANPPYVWMPESERTRSVHAFGGEQGLEIAEAILSDLDRLLGKEGEAHIISDSPVIAGASTLPPVAERALRGTTLGAQFTVIRHKAPTPFQRSRGCSRIDYLYGQVGRQLAPGVRLQRLPRIADLASRCYLSLMAGRR